MLTDKATFRRERRRHVPVVSSRKCVDIALLLLGAHRMWTGLDKIERNGSCALQEQA